MTPVASQRQTGARAPLTRQGVRDLGDNRRRGPDRRTASRADSVCDERPAVAVDVQVSARSIATLERAGFRVAVAAEHGEPDRRWFVRAVAAGCDVVVTPDHEVQGWGRRAGMLVVGLHDAAGNIRPDADELVVLAWNNLVDNDNDTH